MSIRQWTLCKDDQTFILRWCAGREGELLAQIAEQVGRGALPLGEADLTRLIRMIAESIRPGDSAAEALRSMASDPSPADRARPMF